MKTMVKMGKMKKVVKTKPLSTIKPVMNQNQNQNNLYSTHVVAVQTKYYCTVLNMEIVYENMKIIHCMTYTGL